MKKNIIIMKNIPTFENFEYTDELNELSNPFKRLTFKEKFDKKAAKMIKYIEEKKGNVQEITSTENWPYAVMTAMILGTPFAKWSNVKKGFISIGGVKSANGANFQSGYTKEQLQKRFPEYTQVVKAVQKPTQVSENVVSNFSDFIN